METWRWTYTANTTNDVFQNIYLDDTNGNSVTISIDTIISKPNVSIIKTIIETQLQSYSIPYNFVFVKFNKFKKKITVIISGNMTYTNLVGEAEGLATYFQKVKKPKLIVIWFWHYLRKKFSGKNFSMPLMIKRG